MWRMEDSDRGQFLRYPINEAERSFHGKICPHSLHRGTSVAQHRCALIGQPSENLNLCMLSDTVLQEDDTQTFHFETDGLVGLQSQLWHLLTEPRLRLIDALLFLGTSVHHIVFHARLRVKIDSILEDGEGGGAETSCLRTAKSLDSLAHGQETVDVIRCGLPNSVGKERQHLSAGDLGLHVLLVSELRHGVRG